MTQLFRLPGAEPFAIEYFRSGYMSTLLVFLDWVEENHGELATTAQAIRRALQEG